MNRILSEVSPEVKLRGGRIGERSGRRKPGEGGLAAGGVEAGMARHHRVRMAQGDEDCNVPYYVLAGFIKRAILGRKINGLLFDELHSTVLRLASIRVI